MNAYKIGKSCLSGLLSMLISGGFLLACLTLLDSTSYANESGSVVKKPTPSQRTLPSKRYVPKRQDLQLKDQLSEGLTPEEREIIREKLKDSRARGAFDGVSDRSHRFGVGFSFSMGYMKPEGLQDFAGDAHYPMWPLNFSILGFFHPHRHGTFLLEAGKTGWSKTQKDYFKPFVGRYRGIGYPVFLSYGWDMLSQKIDDSDIRSLRWALRLMIGGGAQVGSEFLAENQFEEKLSTKSAVLWGTQGQVQWAWMRDYSPGGAFLALGYRRYLPITFKGTRHTLDISHPFATLGFTYLF